MNPRAFTRLVGDTHEHWLGTILSLTNADRGIDLVGDKLCVELKSRYDKWNPNWAVDNKEYVRFPKENPNKELYWAFILYGLRTSPIDIPRGDNI